MLDKIRTLIRRFLHIPLWLKLLLPNLIVVKMLALVGAVIAVQHVEASPQTRTMICSLCLSWPASVSISSSVWVSSSWP